MASTSRVRYALSEVEVVKDVLEARRRRKFTCGLSFELVGAGSEWLSVAEFEQLGSTQRRENTFQPHHALHRPIPATSLTLSSLLASGAHLGHPLDLSHPSSYSHIYGTRNGVAIIDVRHTLAALRAAAQVVRRTVQQDGTVLFLGSHHRGIDRAVEENAKRLAHNGFASLKWKPGSVSNAAKVFSASSSMIQPDDEGRLPSTLDLRPSLVVALSPTTTQHALREITAANIPTIGITDTNVDPRCVTYAIPANDDAPRTVELIAGTLALAGQEALQWRQEQQQKRLDASSLHSPFAAIADP